jgi:hypothetical protein
MKSWTSTRRPACAPPPKIWISGSGIRTGVCRPDASTTERVASRGGVQHRERRRDQRIAAEPRLVARAVERDQRLVDRLLVGGVAARQRACDLAVDPATARPTSKPPNASRRRADRSLRASRASAGRRDAAPGAPPRARRRLRRSGRPRESQIRRP